MNIVVIRPFKIGDALITFPILIALRAKYANPHITLVCDPVVVPLAKAWNIADTVYGYDEQWKRIFSAGGVRQSNVRDVLRQTDLAICWISDPGDLGRKNLLKAGVKEVLASTTPSQTDNITDIDSMHAMELLARTVNVQLAKPEAIELPYIGPATFCPYDAPIVLHPGSSAPHRRWPSASFAGLIDALLLLHYPVLLLGGPTEDELLREVRQHLSTAPSPAMLTVLKNASLLEVSRKLKQCKCFVGHDTGMSHLAGLLRIPTLALFGSTSPERWRPLGPTVEVIEAQPLMYLPVQRVLDSILRMCNAHH
ncbi:MAG TPA: glycosyltransferase family 9 protein [Ktedonobacteraceae bacterium]|nr:glycosyltransferase family 9 protein [Ktedonobacteraceae bacterium]